MCDQGCAIQSALAVLMALYWRERTGEGQMVDTSIVNAGVHFNTDAWIGPDGWSERPRSDQQQTGLGPLYRLYPTDRRLDRPGLPRRVPLVRPGDRPCPALPGDTRFADPASRRQTPARSRDLCRVLRRPDREGGLRAAGRRRCAGRNRGPGRRAGPGSTNRTSSPPAWSPTTSTPGTDASASSATSCTFSDTPGRIGGPPPLLGQHSREVLTESGLLGRGDRDAAGQGRHPLARVTGTVGRYVDGRDIASYFVS